MQKKEMQRQPLDLRVCMRHVISIRRRLLQSEGRISWEQGTLIQWTNPACNCDVARLFYNRLFRSAIMRETDEGERAGDFFCADAGNRITTRLPRHVSLSDVRSGERCGRMASECR